MTNIVNVLFAVLRSAFKGELLTETEKEFLSDLKNSQELMQIAEKHDIAHLVALGLKKNGVSSNASNAIMTAMYRYEHQNYELARMCDALEKAEIPFIPLKGSVIRKLYPEPWMRTSCDIDVLVKKTDIEKALSCFVNELGYTKHNLNEYDVSFFSPGNIHIELHFELIDGGISDDITETLNDVWKYTSPKDGYSYWCEMHEEMFYFFHIAHMAKHFEIGGCGIRPFIDLWILDKLENADVNKRADILEKGKLLKFAESARKLSLVWLENDKHTDETEKMQNYILTGGVYGTSHNKILLQQQKKGGKLRYIISKIFLPYHTIKVHYPILRKHRWLMPIMQVRRWFKLLFFGIAKKTIEELQYSQNIPQEQADEMQQFLRKIGL